MTSLNAGGSPATPARSKLRLRTQLFAGSALLSSAILVIAAWVINSQVLKQAREQVQAEVETLMPVYDFVWNEYSERLSTLGATMANSAVVKTIIGDERASRDRATLREMLNDFRDVAPTPVDLFIVSDGSGRITFAEMQGQPLDEQVIVGPDQPAWTAAKNVAEKQNQVRGFGVIQGRLFQMVLTPVLIHSGSVDYQNTLAVLATGSEINRSTALQIRERMHSELMFFVDGHYLTSSLDPKTEQSAANEIVLSKTFGASPTSPQEIRVGGQTFLSFSRDLTGLGGESIGRVVVMRSLAVVDQLFKAISNRLFLIWTLSLGAALLLSYLVANRITRPVNELVQSVKEFGEGNYECPVPVSARGEIGTLARTFAGMRSSLRNSQNALLRSERLATIGRMASSVVHDLRNPLATISTAAEVLGRDGLPSERRQVLLESQLRASERMNSMLSEMLEYSRGSYHLRLERCRLVDIVDVALKHLEPVAEREGITTETKVDDSFEVVADAERLRRVFDNLLSNAIQAEPRGGKVLITSRLEDNNENNVRIDIIDHGPGVPAELRDRIFEPFVTYGKAGGTGLGLAIVHGVINAHHGTVGCEEPPERGSCFYVILPLAPREENATP